MFNQAVSIESAVLPVPADQLISQAKAVLGVERQALVKFLAILGSIDSRQICVDAGYASLFTFLTQALHLSEGSAAKRVRACRLVQQHPQTLVLIESGAIHLSAASLLFAHKDDERFPELLRESTFKSARAVEFILAKASPKSGPVRESLRLMVPRNAELKVIPSTTSLESESQPASMSVPMSMIFDGEPMPPIQPSVLSAAKKEPIIDTDVAARLSVTLSQDDYLRLKRMRELMPGLSLGEVIGKALKSLQDKTDPAVRLVRVKRPRGTKLAGIAET